MVDRQAFAEFIAARYQGGETASEILDALRAPVRLGIEIPAKELVRKIEMMRTAEGQIQGVPAGVPMWEIILGAAAGDAPPANTMLAAAWYEARRLIRVRQDNLPIDFGKADIAAELGKLQLLGFSAPQIGEMTIAATEETTLARRHGFEWAELVHVAEAIGEPIDG